MLCIFQHCQPSVESLLYRKFLHPALVALIKNLTRCITFELSSIHLMATHTPTTPPRNRPKSRETGQEPSAQNDLNDVLCFYHLPPIALRRRVVTVRSHRCTGRPGLSDFSWCRASVWTHGGMARFSCFRRWRELPCHCQPISVVFSYDFSIVQGFFVTKFIMIASVV